MAISLQDKAKLAIIEDELKRLENLKNPNNNEDKIKKDIDKLNEFKEQYILIFSYKNDDNGYQGWAYKDKKTSKIYIVHAGSNYIPDNSLKDSIVGFAGYDGFQDWIKTDGELMLDVIPSQFYSAKYFVEYVRERFNNGTNKNMEQIGQSLAGTLVCMLGMLEENKDLLGTAFNTLGAASMEEVLKKKGFKLSGSYININNYFYKDERISRLKEHVGNIYVSNASNNKFHSMQPHTDNLLNYEKVDNYFTVESVLKSSISLDFNIRYNVKKQQIIVLAKNYGKIADSVYKIVKRIRDNNLLGLFNSLSINGNEYSLNKNESNTKNDKSTGYAAALADATNQTTKTVTNPQQPMNMNEYIRNLYKISQSSKMDYEDIFEKHFRLKAERESDNYKGYTNPVTGDNKIYTKEEISRMTHPEYTKHKRAIEAQSNKIGIPSEKHLERISKISGGGVVFVNAYTRGDGVHVNSYYRSAPNR